MRWGIVVGGWVEDYARLENDLALMDRVIACDSGARHLDEIGRRPDLLVGDMDSVDPGLLVKWTEEGIPVQRFRAEKDETDSELAVSIALEAGASEIHLFANQGDRLDHLLANISLLYRIHRQGIKGVVHTDNQEIWLIEGDALVEGPVEQTISFVPMGMEAEGVTLTGFRYPLNDYRYEQGTPIGISNRLAESPARVQVRTGILIAFRTLD